MRRWWTRRAVLVAVVAVMSLAMTGSAAAVTLDFPSWQASDAGFAPYWEALIAEFEKQHPDVEIQFYPVPFSNYVRQMLTRFATGNPPDIFHFPAANFYSFASQPGWLEPLDPYLEGTDIRESWSPLQAQMTYEGETKGILVLGFGYVLGYNERLFEEAGLSVPQNYEEFLEAAKALTQDTDGDGVTDQFGFAFPTVRHPGVYEQATVLIFDSGGHWTTEDGSLDRESITNGLEKMRELLPYTPLGIDDDRKMELWRQGRVGMVIDGPFMQGDINLAREAGNPHLRVAPLPFREVYGGTSNSLGVPAQISAEKKQLVWEFIELMTRPEWQRAYAEITGLPPQRDGVVTPEILAAQPNLATFMEQTAVAKDYIPPMVVAGFPEFRDYAVDAVLDYLLNGRSLDRVLNELESNLKRIQKGAAR